MTEGKKSVEEKFLIVEQSMYTRHFCVENHVEVSFMYVNMCMYIYILYLHSVNVDEFMSGVWNCKYGAGAPSIFPYFHINEPA